MNPIAMRIGRWLGSMFWLQRRHSRGQCIGSGPQGSAADAVALANTPVARGMGLGLRLGFLTTLVVSGVMALVTGGQLAWDLHTELRDRQSLLSESLSPLAAELHGATNREEAQAAVTRFHSSFVVRGRERHYLAIIDASGQLVVEEGERPATTQAPLLSANMSLTSAALGAEPVTLVVAQDGTDYLAARARRWWGWALHVALTAAATLALLHVVIRREVTGPIERLLTGVQMMELGYWDAMPDPGGAWEVRWLGWRFRALANELSRTAAHLIAAQRRAYAAAADTHARVAGAAPAEFASPELPRDDAGEAICALQTSLRRLEDRGEAEVDRRALARLAWDRLAPRAERLGRPDLRIELEDAAFQVLDPDGFHDVSRQLHARRSQLDAQVRQRTGEIRHSLATRGVPVLRIGCRIKHAAGIWKKMREKNLSFDQVHDLLAMRVVVPTESDCYHALGVVHDLYPPVIGRFKDYIAAPKENGYRGLHTSARDRDQAVFEIQIRSAAMHQFAEEGAAAHANYKDGKRLPVPGEDASRKSVQTLRQGLERAVEATARS
ncbi:bifunctional (p)ppGpp synthetase/guanosine-3',5'-bis(diphosphate) 3'-pyrophosphohydrolase [Ramlibacter sp. RBP-2]|uniref:Bifunctional (P)ppGpp synthetase/guanosine-3',5'-bis(Diphosphate) 3'-pyrophosphohydrolase n=1 Tax=Ramlibacter lithotrophicus TaxID=2606681 RepID=A0A7X6DI50_9BURK|nr:bifunctional (p)ppGpp synthetase/guanosine-3',5'-bis(diphosphate) 3'-pyrophosphohydrolase [Ramlibacter lithotrophicus]